MVREDTRFEDFVGLVDALHKEIQRIKAAEAARLGFKGADVMCLYYLTKHPDGLTGSELARLVDVSRAAMSRTIARLESDGLVEAAARGDETRYRVPVRLTEKGAEVALPIEGIIHDVLDETGRVLDARQRAQMYDSLNVVLDSLRKIARD
ncbi:MAG TPA: MarR family transcriptional regulator [Candidatus Olsenella pullistercoris]|uniref:MarR family transcriptional regulator n=1 Tax=Candidatus Olsenella pullistercoris TaxID=2838712 RepID=A0A9D2EXR7_9ACTN|nr:MarR family transcriptional regulator [Candidatus Olsenella pullistercoris]